MDQLKSFKVTPQQRQYFQHTQCFNLCVKDYKDNILNATQKNCLKSCFKKYQTVEKFFLDKLNETMEYLAINDPALRLKFDQSHKKLNK